MVRKGSEKGWDMGKLDGKTALITGAGRGQGRSHALHLADEGAKIVACDVEGQPETLRYEMNSKGDLAETARLVEERGGEIVTMFADVRKASEMEAFAQKAIDSFGQIDILIANAGICITGPSYEMSHPEWDDQIDVLLNGVWRAYRAVVPHMIEREYGRIIITSSGAGRMGIGNLAAYSAAKWGLIGFAKSAAIDLGHKGITVNIVCPWNADTPMLVNDMMKDLFLGGEEGTWADVDELIVNAGIHKMPVPRIPPEDISKAVVFLASEDARYISGSTLDVSAGGAAAHT
jgi:SDR family mycofactocin-dependent oxidoreductase